MYDLSHVFTKSNLKILRLLKKEEGLYIREIAEILAISPFSVHNSFKLFKKLGFFEEKKVKNRKTIYLVRDNPILKKIFSLINISDLSGNESFKKLIKSGKVGVYGSFASGEDTKESDIDLWFYKQENVSYIELREITREIEKDFGMEVKLLVLHDSKIKDIMENDPEFFYRLKLSSIAVNGDVFG
ncbi:MAG: nucleotidyltransferase domain-containing protein [ANME-2 cluster archaeon]|nr:nucleotidyltransferase domain-containing protein [ANME-2 cluster archaeon]MDF1531716.1 nucleotidyltransferase domain-containing protein [ANME-2 cluster archaeon]